MKQSLKPLLLIMAGILVLATLAYVGEQKGWCFLHFGQDGHSHHGHSH